MVLILILFLITHNAIWINFIRQIVIEKTIIAINVRSNKKIYSKEKYLQQFNINKKNLLIIN